MTRHALLLSLTGALLALAGLASPARAQDPARVDVLIRDGRIVDGTGNPWYRGDVAVRDGTITAVGHLPDVTAERVIDARGMVVAPGFIDLHSHADDALAGRGRPSLRDDDVERKGALNLVAQGVTTVVVNQDGRSPWPIREQRQVLERQGTGVNVILLVGHGAVRSQVMGRDVQRPATPEEVAEMQGLVRQAMEEGAFGISAGLEYYPGRWSTTDEIAELVAAARPWDGVYISHERSEGPDPMWFWPSQDDPGAPTLLDAVLETIEVGRRSGAAVVASHIKAKGAHYWGTSHVVIQLIERARDEGVRVWADQYPYPTSGSDGSTVLIPGWALRDPADDDRTPAEVLRETLDDPEKAADLRLDIAHEIRRRGGADRVVIFEYPNEAYVGESLADVATAMGVEPVEAAIRLQLEGDPERRGGGRLRGFSMSEDDVEAYAARPWVATASDGGLARPGDGSVHPRFYGTFPRKIRHYALDEGVLGMEDAVRSMTSLPALILGLRDRGLVREGFRADLVVFDPERIRDRATFFEPHQYPEGIPWVLVNGEPVVDGGEFTRALPGRVIPSERRGGEAAATGGR